MKKIMSILTVLSACALLAACGGNGDINENTDPVALESEKVTKEQWATAFASQENYCMKTLITSSKTENEAIMSEVTTIDFCNDGERICLTLETKSGDETVLEAEAYAELGEEHAFWTRSKEGDGDWSEWKTETFSSEQFADFFGGYLAPTFARDSYSAFSYSESEKGYEATEEGLTSIESAANAYISAALAQSSVDAEDLTAEKFVLKFKDGKPSACLFDLGAKATDTAESTKEPRREHIPPMPHPVPLPHIGLSRHGRLPRILIRIRPVPREPIGPDVPETPAVSISCSQLFYNYGKARVTFPEDLPPLNEQ